MQVPFLLLVIVLHYLIHSTLSITTLNSYITPWNPAAAQTFVGQYIYDNGKVGFVTVKDTTLAIRYYIRKYDLTVDPPIKIIQASAVNGYDRFFVFNGYLVAWTTYGTTLYIYNYTSLAFIASKNVYSSYAPVQFAHAKTKGLVVFTVTAGYTCYINQANFPFSMDMSFGLIAFPNQTGIRYSGSLSKSQQYYAMVCVDIQKIMIASLNNFSIIFSSDVQYQLRSGTWHQTQDVAYITTSTDYMLYVVNVTNSFAIEIIPYIPNTYTKFPLNIKYFAETNELTGVALAGDGSFGFFSFHLATWAFNSIDGLLSSPTGSGISSDSSFLWVYTATSISFKEITGCAAGSIFNSAIRSCQSCANLTRCSKSVLPVPTPLTNNTNATVFNFNGSANSTNITNSSNTTNSTNSSSSNTTQNLTNPLLLSNTTSSNDFVNSQHVVNYESFINNTLGNPAVSALNQFPASRKAISTVFSFFVNFDDLWLYNYHPRNYDPILTIFFTKISQLEREKWSLLPFQKIVYFLGFHKDTYENFFIIRRPYTNAKFLEVENNENGFLPNTPNFLFSNIFFTFFFFLSVRMLVKLAQGFKIILPFKEYKFWAYLFLMIIEGNLQYFSYILTFDMTKLFSTTIGYKMINFTVIMICFCFVLFGGFIYFFLKQGYGIKSGILFGNFGNTLDAMWHLTLCVTWRNLILGAIHYFYEEDYNKKILLLVFVEVVVISQQIKQISNKKTKSVVKHKLILWYEMIFPSAIRISLIFCMFMTYSKDLPNQTIANQGFMKVQIKLIYCYMAAFFVSVTGNLFIMAAQIISTRKGNRKKNKIFLAENKTIKGQKVKFKQNKTPKVKASILPKSKFIPQVKIIYDYHIEDIRKEERFVSFQPSIEQESFVFTKQILKYGKWKMQIKKRLFLKNKLMSEL